VETAMSGFDLAELLPFYLDETDEHISALNDALLRLEQDATDVKALQEAFRMFHSIKGASVVMGFQPVNQLTHHLESLFDQLRSKKRELDRATLDLTFRCLDELRDYHRDLRAQKPSTGDLSGLVAQVVDYLQATESAGEKTSKSTLPSMPWPVPPTSQQLEPKSFLTPPALPIGSTGIATAEAAAKVDPFAEPGGMALVVVFQPNLPLADMKARVVLNRLSTKVRVLSTDPPAERLDETDPLTRFTVFLTTDCDADELRRLADVEGVTEIRIEPLTTASPTTSIISVLNRSEPRSDRSSESLLPQEEAISSLTPTVLPSPSLPSTISTAASTSSIGPSQTTTMAGKHLAESTTSKQPFPSKKGKITETIRVESDRLDHLMNLAGELVITKARFVAIARDMDELFRGSNARALTSDTRERLESITRGLEGLAESKSGSTGGSLDRWSVHFRRLRDNFRAIQDELDVIRDAREQLKSLSETIHSLGRVSDGLQKGVLDTRMVPIGPLFERFRRVIRDLSLASGKEVMLQISGEKTELDKRMIDELSDPLIHMVRNAVDHGLELPGEREAAGKPRAGSVVLLASHRGNSVVITVSDDGRGINIEQIRKKIVAKGLVSKTEAHDLTDRELITFIWHPGLSTAETVTEISGRGVGMDIVKSRIENLSGTVDVRSLTGHGSTFTIRLPLTLAIMSSLLVRIYEEIYAIPLDHIDEIVEVRPSQIYRVQGRPAIEIRKKIVALVALDDVFRWGGRSHPSAYNRGKSFADSHPTTENGSDKCTIVVVQNGDTTIGLLVDQLIGMQEVVLKSLEKNFRTIPGLSGASILGDGRVSLILDLDAVLELVARQPAHRREDAMSTANFK
jgi:two-component system, chemotaxis family, sensor kinase CheA